MALFKIFRGKSEELNKVKKVDGYAYFCIDDGSFWIDYEDTQGELKRIQINSAILQEFKNKIDTLIDDDLDKSVRTIAKEEVDSIIDGASEEFNTFKEIAAWIETHGEDAANMLKILTALENEIGGTYNATTGEVSESRIDLLEGKPAYDITADQISNWDNEIGVKAAFTEYNNQHASDYTNTQIDEAIDGAIEQEVTRANNAYDVKGAAATAKSEATSYTDSIIKSYTTTEIQQGIDKAQDDRLNNLEIKVAASFGTTLVKAVTITELLSILYEGFESGIYTMPEDKTITYNVYGYNEYAGHFINSKWHNFSIDGIFLNINIVGYQNAELKTISTHQSGPLFLFSDYDSIIVTNVHISNVKFSNYTPQATSWEYGYFKFRCGHDGTLSIDNCLFLENGLRLNEGSSNSVTNCQFQSTNSSKYCLWVGCNAFKSGYLDTLQDVIIDNCTFTGYRGIKILTDTKTTHTSENTTTYKRESQSITISNCLFKDLTKKPGIVVDSRFTDADGHSSFYTGESKLRIFNTSFINCTEGTIIVDDAFKSTKGILYSIDGAVYNAYNVNSDAGIVCETSIMKGLAFIHDPDSIVEDNVITWKDGKLVDSGIATYELVTYDTFNDTLNNTLNNTLESEELVVATAKSIQPQPEDRIFIDIVDGVGNVLMEGMWWQEIYLVVLDTYDEYGGKIACSGIFSTYRWDDGVDYWALGDVILQVSRGQGDDFYVTIHNPQDDSIVERNGTLVLYKIGKIE